MIAQEDVGRLSGTQDVQHATEEQARDEGGCNKSERAEPIAPRRLAETSDGACDKEQHGSEP